MPTLTVKVSADLAARLKRAGKQRGISKSELTRRALEKEVPKASKNAGLSLYDRMKDGIGCFDSGVTDLSTNKKILGRSRKMEASAPVIVDSGVLVAVLDTRDQHHDWAQAALKDIRVPLRTCDAVVTETTFLVGLRPHVLRQLEAWFDSGNIRVEYESQRLIGQAFTLMDTYSNVPMSYADACLVCMVESRPRSRVFTLDSDFRIYRQRNRRVVPLLAPFV